MKPDIEQAIEDLRRCFSDADVVAEARDDGSAIVTIDSVDVGELYTPQRPGSSLRLPSSIPLLTSTHFLSARTWSA